MSLALGISVGKNERGPRISPTSDAVHDQRWDDSGWGFVSLADTLGNLRSQRSKLSQDDPTDPSPRPPVSKMLTA